MAFASMPNSMHHLIHSFHTDERGPASHVGWENLQPKCPAALSAKPTISLPITSDKNTCYISRIKFCNCWKTAIGARLAIGVICLIVRVQQHAFKPAIYCWKKLQDTQDFEPSLCNVFLFLSKSLAISAIFFKKKTKASLITTNQTLFHFSIPPFSNRI